jgi:HlyD family secretion protein
MTMDRLIEKKKRTKRKLLKISALAVPIILILYLSMFGINKSSLNVKSEILTISIVEKAPFQEFIPVAGEVKPILSIYLDAVEGGQVVKIYHEAGSLLKKGEMILKLENTNLLLDIMYREAQAFEQSNNLRNSRLLLEQNRLSLNKAVAESEYETIKLKRNYERQKRLYEEGLISRQEYENTTDDYEYSMKKLDLSKETRDKELALRTQQIKQLDNSYKRMQVNLDTIKKKMENLIIKSPISGQLSTLNAEVGQSISAGMRIGQIDVLEGYKIKAKVDENYIDRVEVGKIGQFDFSEKMYSVKVKKIYPEVKNGAFDIDMEFIGKEPEGIKRGQTVYIRLQLSDVSESIVVPRGAFYQETGGNWIYVLDKSEKFATKRNIKLGRQNPAVYEVLDGLVPGEKVITSSYETFGNKERLVLDLSHNEN